MISLERGDVVLVWFPNSALCRLSPLKCKFIESAHFLRLFSFLLSVLTILTTRVTVQVFSFNWEVV